jgi:hypothetical protein
MGLQSHFQWFTQLDENYPTRYCQIWTISPDAKPILYVEGHLFSKAHFIW